jgi:hypothetical protein
MTKCISTKRGPITLGFGASVPLIGANCCHISVGMGRNQLVEVWVEPALYKVVQGEQIISPPKQSLLPSHWARVHCQLMVLEAI